jgi:oligopeptide/dipeptide ABC transporter ATP-binding protein
MRLIYPPGKIVNGEVIFKGEDLLGKDEKGMRQIRGNDISMIFQEPMTSLNPVYTVGKQISNIITLHQKTSGKEAMEKALEMLHFVQLPDPEAKLKQYPHELSGGMQQRVMIAMALSCHPSLLIADEPTTYLDVTVERQILNFIKGLKQKLRMSILFITHDLGITAEMADDVATMYAGHIVEYAPVKEFFKRPFHPYTCGLLRSLPHAFARGKKLAVIPGTVASLISPPKGCIFRPRCGYATEICREKEPELIGREGRLVACHNALKGDLDG